MLRPLIHPIVGTELVAGPGTCAGAVDAASGNPRRHRFGRSAFGAGALVRWVTLLVFLLPAIMWAPLSWAQPQPRSPAPAPAPPTDDTGNPKDAPPPPPKPAQPAPRAPRRAAPPVRATLPPSEAELAEGRPIEEVRIVGNRRIAVTTIRALLKSMVVGKPFSPKGMGRDVRELWDQGFFEDIEVDLSNRNDKVILRILLRERPGIKEVTFEGNSAIKDGDLKDVVAREIDAGDTLNYGSIRRTVQRLRDKYAEDGYFLSEVSYEVLPQKDNQVEVRFKIKEHEKVTVRRVTFIGNHNVAESRLRDLMITGKGSLFSFGSGGPFRQDAFERDIVIISSHYYDEGFLTVNVAAPRVMLTPDRTGIDIVITIDEGPRFKIRRMHVLEVDADGKEIPPLGGRQKLREMVTARSGDNFNRAELVKDLERVKTYYRDAGYARAEAPPQTQLYPDADEVDIIVRVRRGPPVRFGRIEVRGNTKTRDPVIRRELEIAEGELFSETSLERSRRRVAALGYFERVDINTEDSDDGKYVNVTFEIQEKPTGTFQVGAGFSSIESFIATAQIQQQNLFGTGQSLSLTAQLSGLRQLVNIQFAEPYLFDTQFSLQVQAFDQLRIYSQFALDSTGGTITFGYPIVNPELRVSLAYTVKNDVVDTQTSSTLFGTASAVSVFQSLPIANLFNDGLTSSLRPTITYDTRNNRLFPSAGLFLQGSTELAIAAIGSENQFVRHRLTGRFYLPLFDSVVFKVQSQMGLVTSPSSDGVPLFARFFVGGIFDLRGYRLRTIGPRLPLKSRLDENAPSIPNGANIGGNLQYVQNIEIEFPVVDAVGLRGVLFTDLGNAWNLEQVYCQASPAAQFEVTDPCFEPGDIFNVRSSVGFGLRWFSPLGPLRFEWGFPLKRLDYEEASTFEFTIGNFF